MAAAARVPIDNTEAVARIASRIDAIGERDARGCRFLGLSAFQLGLLLVTGTARALETLGTLNFIVFLDSVGDRNTLRYAFYIGALLGALLFGLLADKFGRRPVFMLSLTTFLLGVALHDASEDTDLMTFFYGLAGFGFGGEVPVASMLLHELSPATTRSRLVVLLEAFWAIGFILTALVQTVDLGDKWHVPLFLICTPMLMVATFFTTHESPKWLASVGRYEEAVAIVEKIERAHGLEPLDDKVDLDDVDTYHVTAPRLSNSYLKRAALLLRPLFVTRTLVLCALWFVTHLAYCQFFLYALVGMQYFELYWETNILIASAALLGCVLASSTARWMGLRRTLITCLIGASASALGFGSGDSVSQVQVVVVGSLLAFFFVSAVGCLHAYALENYPTAIRGVGTAWPSMFQHVAMLVAPVFYNIVSGAEWETIDTVSNTNFGATLHITSVIVVVVCAVAFCFGVKTKHRNVEVFFDDNDNHATADQFPYDGMRGNRFRSIETP